MSTYIFTQDRLDITSSVKWIRRGQRTALIWEESLLLNFSFRQQGIGLLLRSKKPCRTPFVICCLAWFCYHFYLT